ncbi:unnamed protein product [Caretta caretta]
MPAGLGSNRVGLSPLSPPFESNPQCFTNPSGRENNARKENEDLEIERRRNPISRFAEVVLGRLKNQQIYFTTRDSKHLSK